MNVFKQLADRKKEITDDDLYAIVDDKSRDKGKKYELVRYQITTGNQVINHHFRSLKEDGVVKTCASTGEGPIDACYNAINRNNRTRYKANGLQYPCGNRRTRRYR